MTAGREPSSESGRWSPRVVGVLGGVFFVAFGLWAMAGPASFFDAAAFPPYNRHFLQDIGAFQIGLGAVFLLAALPARPDALAVALLGVWHRFGRTHRLAPGRAGSRWRAGRHPG